MMKAITKEEAARFQEGFKQFHGLGTNGSGEEELGMTEFPAGETG